MLGILRLPAFIALTLSVQVFTNVGAPPSPPRGGQINTTTLSVNYTGPYGDYTDTYSSDDPQTGTIAEFWARARASIADRDAPVSRSNSQIRPMEHAFDDFMQIITRTLSPGMMAGITHGANPFIPLATLDHSQISRGRPTQHGDQSTSSNGWRPPPRAKAVDGSRPLPSTSDAENQLDELEKRLLDKHNIYRTYLGLPPLVYDPEISKISRAYAGKLLRRVANGHHRDIQGKYGENITKRWSAKGYGLKTIESTIDDWYMEGQYFVPGFTNESESHYAQMMSADSKRLGIGIANDSKTGEWIIVCNYDPPKNNQNLENNASVNNVIP